MNEKILNTIEKITLCPGCGKDLDKNNISEEYDTVLICPCGTRVYIG